MTLSELRTGPVATLANYETAMWCPTCACPKSGDASEPNRTAEWCDSETCPCHAADETVA